jgi:hypothetical protein
MKLPQFHFRDLFWLLVVVCLSLAWLYRDASLRQRLAGAEASLSNLEAEQASVKEREEALAQQEEALAQKKAVYLNLINDVDVVKRKCESILDDYADLRNKARLPGAGSAE